MIRRRMESGSNQFGMTPSPDSEYGTMLHIQKYEQQSGRHFGIFVKGGQRFKVKSISTLDGYSMAKVEWIEDVEPSVGHELAENAKLECQVRKLLQDFICDSRQNNFPPIPTDNKFLPFYATAVMQPVMLLTTESAWKQFAEMMAYGEATLTSHNSRLKNAIGVHEAFSNVRHSMFEMIQFEF